MFGVDFTITFSAVVIKSSRIYRIVRHSAKSVKPPVWIKNYQQLLSAFAIIFVQVNIRPSRKNTFLSKHLILSKVF